MQPETKGVRPAPEIRREYGEKPGQSSRAREEQRLPGCLRPLRLPIFSGWSRKPPDLQQAAAYANAIHSAYSDNRLKRNSNPEVVKCIH